MLHISFPVMRLAREKLISRRRRSGRRLQRREKFDGLSAGRQVTVVSTILSLAPIHDVQANIVLEKSRLHMQRTKM